MQPCIMLCHIHSSNERRLVAQTSAGADFTVRLDHKARIYNSTHDLRHWGAQMWIQCMHLSSNLKCEPNTYPFVYCINVVFFIESTTEMYHTSSYEWTPQHNIKHGYLKIQCSQVRTGRHIHIYMTFSHLADWISVQIYSAVRQS